MFKLSVGIIWFLFNKSIILSLLLNICSLDVINKWPIDLSARNYCTGFHYASSTIIIQSSLNPKTNETKRLLNNGANTFGRIPYYSTPADLWPKNTPIDTREWCISQIAVEKL